jgi:hypothetical protein
MPERAITNRGRRSTIPHRLGVGVGARRDESAPDFASHSLLSTSAVTEMRSVRAITISAPSQRLARPGAYLHYLGT